MCRSAKSNQQRYSGSKQNEKNAPEVPFTEPEEYIYQILLKEQLGREQAKIARNLKQARFIDTKTLESYQWHKDICLPNHLSKEELEPKKNQNYSF